MALRFDDLRVLQAAEEVADNVWKTVVVWDEFAREVVGRQLAKAADSVGANIAEAFGRYHYGEKIQFLYYARGSLFETKYWVNRARARGLIPAEQAENYAQTLNVVARQINSFAQMIRGQRKTKGGASLAESPAFYSADSLHLPDEPIFDDIDLEALLSNTHPISNQKYPLPNT